MGAKGTIKKPRVVLDTNCIVSALLFSKGSLAWLRDAWMRQRFIPLISRDTAGELIRVLNYPKFQLDKNEQEIILAEFLPYAEVVHIEIVPKNLPKLQDQDDLIFLALAVYGKADALISGDAHILAVKSQLGPINVLAVAEFAAWLEERY
jgi:putative PIN family toxin of toxin-antitoxin system